MTFKVTFTNFSLKNFHLAQSQYNIADLVSSMSQTPSQILKANSGVETIETVDSGFLSNVGSGAGEVWCVWQEPNSNLRFGIHLYTPSYTLSISSSSLVIKAVDVLAGDFNADTRSLQWEYMQDTATAEAPVTWISNGNDPSKPVILNKLPGGFNIQARPTVGSERIEIAVTISN